MKNPSREHARIAFPTLFTAQKPVRAFHTQSLARVGLWFESHSEISLVGTAQHPRTSSLTLAHGGCSDVIVCVGGCELFLEDHGSPAT